MEKKSDESAVTARSAKNGSRRYLKTMSSADFSDVRKIVREKEPTRKRTNSKIFGMRRGVEEDGKRARPEMSRVEFLPKAEG